MASWRNGSVLVSGASGSGFESQARRFLRCATTNFSSVIIQFTCQRVYYFVVVALPKLATYRENQRRIEKLGHLQ
jgi:hypothetical protein